MRPAASLLPLAVLVGLAWVAVGHAPAHADVTGLWPVGLGTGAVLLAPPAWRVRVAAAVGGIAAGAVVAGPQPDVVALGSGPAIAFEVWVAARLLQHRDGRRPELRTDDDLRRYFAAAFVGAGSTSTVVGLTSAITGHGSPARVAGAVGLAHLASQLYLVPTFLRLPTQGAIARGGERVAQWTVLLVGIPVLFLPDASPSLAFLVLPILAWGALRVTPVESVIQLLLVTFLAIVLTSYGDGPFADAPVRYGLPPDVRGVLLSAFCATCAVIVVPLVLRVGEYVGAARSAAAERDLVRGIVDGATGTAIVVTDPGGRITLFNPGAERLLGYASDEVIGEHASMLHTRAAVRDKARELGVDDDFASVARAIVERRLVATAMRVRCKDGVERTHATTLSRLTVTDRTIGFVSTSEDITDLLATEQALRDALEVERQAVERLRDVDAVKDQFVSTVSHELRTPLTSILGYLEMLADGTLGELGGPQVDALVRVQSNSQRLLSLIEDLLTLSRVADEGLRPEQLPFDLRAAVRTAYDVVAPSWATPRDLDVSIELPEEPVPVRGDRGMLEWMVVNLVGNAVKFTDDGGRVGVDLRRDHAAGQAVLQISDTGIGIPDDEQAQLFTRFFRSSLAERRAIPGSGLGLSIAQAVTEQHGGSIAVTSRPAVGTTVEVRLPAGPGMSKFQLPLDE